MEYFYFEIWRFEKHIALSEKKPPLGTGRTVSSFFRYTLVDTWTLTKENERQKLKLPDHKLRADYQNTKYH